LSPVLSGWGYFRGWASIGAADRLMIRAKLDRLDGLRTRNSRASAVMHAR